MLLVQFLRDKKDRVLASLAKRNFNDVQLVDKAIALDDSRKNIQTQMDLSLAESNKIAKEIPNLMKSGNKDEAEKLKARAIQIKEETASFKLELEAVKNQLEQILLALPNCLADVVVPGKDAEDNEVFKPWPTDLPKLHEGALPHWELAALWKIIDFELGAKVTGAGFPFYRGKGAKIQRALINFFLEEATNAGYLEYMPPLMVNRDSARGTGQYPDKDDQMYYANIDELYLIPTAEVPVTNIYRDVILQESDLPLKLTAYTPCFRREAGGYGAHVRGLNRLHQFDKVEIVQFEHPSRSYQTLETMVKHVESLLQKLELPYRILRLCGGDTGFSSALTYDFEVWSAAQERWLEVSSVSNFETFQANRMQCRFKPTEGKNNELVHTLNGSALALPRILAAILENHQQPDLRVRIPKALQAYTRFEFID